MFRQTFKSQRKLRGKDVIYSRGVNSVTVKGIPGQTPSKVDDSKTGIQFRVTNRDYIFLPEELILGGEQIWPEAGDTITESDGTVYEVLRKMGMKENWEWFDQRKEVIRVHLQLVVGT